VKIVFDSRTIVCKGFVVLLRAALPRIENKKLIGEKAFDSLSGVSKLSATNEVTQMPSARVGFGTEVFCPLNWAAEDGGNQFLGENTQCSLKIELCDE
jgi:hypothetical protein